LPEGAEVEWAGGPSPPPCGQLTRCFSAVAELLVADDRMGVSSFNWVYVGTLYFLIVSQVTTP